MQPVFVPTLVPKGTLKSMAKRMHKHPSGQHLTLAQCQEVLARTFGHASWHALQSYQRPDRSGDLLRDPQQRTVFYAILLYTLEAGIPLQGSVKLMKTAAQRLERWDWNDLTQALGQDLQAGMDAAEALSRRVEPFSSVEAFLLKQGNKGNGLISALQETKALSEQEVKNRQDHIEHVHNQLQNASTNLQLQRLSAKTTRGLLGGVA